MKYEKGMKAPADILESIQPLRKPAESKIDSAALAAELRRRVDGEVRFDLGSRALYATDGSNYRQVPVGVVIPRTTEAVVQAVEVCRKFGAPVANRGGGTALAGQTCNTAVVIDFSKYLNKILEIDPKRKIARVQPGLILDHLRKKAQKEYGLTFGPDPATHTHCTFGGMIGNNSCGIHSVMAGRTADNIHELEVLTYDGVRMRVGETSERKLSQLIASGGQIGEIYGRLKTIRDRHADIIRRKYPKIPRRVSGYNLDELLPESGFHVARALVGSEGTCVTVLEATLRLVDYPAARTLLVLGYPDVYSAGDHVSQVMEYGPIGLEGIDDHLVEYMKKKNLHPQDIQLLPNGKGWLLVEFGGKDKKETDGKAMRAMAALKKMKDPPSMKLFTDLGEEEKVWEIRESGLGATAFVPGLPLCWPGWEDAAVPPDKVGEYLRDFRRLLEKHKYIAALYGHFGQGCIHCRISFDLLTHDGIQKYLHFIQEASDLVESYGGSFSGEHGDGQSRAMLLPKMYGEELMDAFRAFKSTWDPDWKMNPGKVVGPYRSDENLRLGTDYSPPPLQTHFQFPQDEGSFARAALRCVGVGKCRRLENAFMCPSFLVTQEEKDTTRGRAHMLFEMVRADSITDGWKSGEVMDSLDLCLACKGCKTDCPVNVDMATYKAEFLAHYYQGRLRPAHAYAMGLIGLWGRIGSRIPSLANYFSQTPGLRRVTKAAAGISPHRRLPTFAAERFTDWFARREPGSPGGEPVVLYPDVFNDYFFPNALRAAAELLEHWGYSIVVPRGHTPAIRPEIHYGMLNLAKSGLLREIRRLAPYAREGIPMLVLEPSTASIFRDELPGLFPSNHDGQRLSLQTHLLSEFIRKYELPLPKLEGKVLFHAHCHQKAVLDPEAGRKVLEEMGLEFEEPQKGCCGMAGSFGFEKKHYDLSIQIGEQYLLPAVREAARDTYVVADGFSCRTQIMESSDRHPMHMSEMILMALRRRSQAPRPYPEQGYVQNQSPILSQRAAAFWGAAIIGGGWALQKYLSRKHA